MLLLLATRRSSATILGATLAATAVVCALSLADRVFSDGRLVGQVGYWNGLALVCAVGTVLALGFATEGSQRPLAAATPVFFISTLYLTYSRGGMLVLAAGLAVELALSPRRLRLAGTAALLVPPCALAAAVASRWDGVRFRLALLALALLAAAVPLAVDALARRLHVGPRLRHAGTLSAGIAAAAVVAFGLVRAGGLGATASRAYSSFSGPAPTSGVHGRSFLSASGAGRAEYWHVAWRDFVDHPLLGSGAGTFALAWDRDRHTIYDVLDAHSIYIEVLGELGPIGLLLIVGTFAAPLVALRRIRRDSAAAAGAGAYVAYLLHAGLDWDWEVPAVSLTGLACGCALLVAARERPFELTLRVRAGALAAAGLVAAFVAFAYVGNVHLARGTRAYYARRYTEAEAEARSAARVLRWSADPWKLRGDAELASGLVAPAHASYLRALELDSRDWRHWYDAGISTKGAERERALARAARLNPLARPILALRGQLASGGAP